MNFLYGIIVGLIFGFLISYFVVRYNSREIRKYVIEVYKTEYNVSHCYPYIYRCISDSYFYKRLQKILDENDIKEYTIKIENNDANIKLKTTKDKLKEIINCINENEEEFYTIKIKQK